jgi:hypothetical protein
MWDDAAYHSYCCRGMIVIELREKEREREKNRSATKREKVRHVGRWRDR